MPAIPASTEVALKILPPALANDAERLQRFQQEARILSALNHANLLAIYDVGVHDGIHYLVSEFLEGQTLRTWMDGGPAPQRKVLGFSQQMATGLAAAHDKGIVHRDLKPENVFVTQDEKVKILDFGLSKQARAEAADETATLSRPLTEVGMVLGTLSYMSPEQVRGQATDHRSDIFSFGGILYEMVTGKRAFKGNSHVETMNAILNAEPPELAESSPPASPGIERIVRRCLEKSPSRRFQSASDLAFAIESLSETSGVRPPALGPGKPIRRDRPFTGWRERRPLRRGRSCGQHLRCLHPQNGWVTGGKAWDRRAPRLVSGREVGARLQRCF